MMIHVTEVEGKVGRHAEPDEKGRVRVPRRRRKNSGLWERVAGSLFSDVPQYGTITVVFLQLILLVIVAGLAVIVGQSGVWGRDFATPVVPPTVTSVVEVPGSCVPPAVGQRVKPSGNGRE